MANSPSSPEVSRYISQMVQDDNLEALDSLRSEVENAISQLYETRRKADEERISRKTGEIAINFEPLAKEVGSFEPATDFAVNLAVRFAAQEFFYGKDDDMVPCLCRKYSDLPPAADKDACMTYAVDLARRAIRTAQDCFYKYWTSSIYYNDDTDPGHTRSLYFTLYALMQSGYDQYQHYATRGRRCARSDQPAGQLTERAR